MSTDNPAIPFASVSIPATSRKQLDTLCQEIRALQERISALDKKKKELSNTLKQLYYACNLPDNIVSGSWQLLHIVAQVDTIEKSRLLEKGVKPAIIEYATVVSVRESVQVRGVKGANKG